MELIPFSTGLKDIIRISSILVFGCGYRRKLQFNLSHVSCEMVCAGLTTYESKLDKLAIPRTLFLDEHMNV